MAVKMEHVDMGVRYTHNNGNMLDIVGEYEEGEWGVTLSDGSSGSSGIYVRDASTGSTEMQDDSGNVVATLDDEDSYDAWAEKLLA